MWCERDGAAVCVVCLVVGPHKGHDAVTIEEAEARGREAVRAELARVEAAIGEVDATMARATVRAADELKSAAEARAAVKRHFDQMREAVAQRELALGVEIDEWTRARAEAAAKQLDELDEVKRRLAAAGKAIQRQQPGSGSISAVVAAGEEVRLAATTAVKATGVRMNSIAFWSGAIQDVKSSGRLVKELHTTSSPSSHFSARYAAPPSSFGGTSSSVQLPLAGRPLRPGMCSAFGRPSTRLRCYSLSVCCCHHCRHHDLGLHSRSPFCCLRPRPRPLPLLLRCRSLWPARGNLRLAGDVSSTLHDSKRGKACSTPKSAAAVW
jgi:hypothetical protein